MTKPFENNLSTTDVVLIGTKIGKCDICKATKKILLLKYGFNLCEDCLSICTSILEQLQSEAVTNGTKAEVKA